jgi:hypothetical protein
MKPRLHFNIGQSGADMTYLSITLQKITGLKFGYHPVEMIDVFVLSAFLTLCGHPRMLSATKRQRIEDVCRAWAAGRGVECQIEWKGEASR